MPLARGCRVSMPSTSRPAARFHTR
jgi:hypothetical protein